MTTEEQRMKTKREIIDEALEDYCGFFRIPIPAAMEELRTVRRHYQNKERSKTAADLCEKWYASLTIGKPDYSVYDSEFYFCELLACFDLYSSRYIKSISKLDIKPKRILDLGCGLGLTSRQLRETFAAEVVGTNLLGTRQAKFCAKTGIQLAGSPGDVEPCDMVFGSEYFEHIQDAPDHLYKILQSHRPKTLVMANAFGSRSVGHFDKFDCYDVPSAVKSIRHSDPIKASTMGRFFGDILRGAGYEQMKTGFWNNRPSVWTRIEGEEEG